MNVKLWINNVNYGANYKRIFMLSDIHNHYMSYCEMRDKLGFSEDDLVVVAGDIVDRGGIYPDPLGICSEIRFEKNRPYKVIMLRGNHEQWLSEAIMRYCENGINDYHYNSLDILLNKLDKSELISYARWMKNLPLSLEMEVEGFKRRFKIAHASTVDLNSEKECLMGSHDFYLNSLNDNKYTNVVGHTVSSMVRYYFEEFSNEINKENTDIFRIGNKMWCIDCGNGFRDEIGYLGKLGCIELGNNGKVIEHYV